MLPIIFLCFSVVFLIISFLISRKKMYGLFLGYENLSFLQKKNIEMDKVARKISISFNIIAFIFLICAISAYYELDFVYSLLILFVFVIYFPYILISIQRFDFNVKPTESMKKAKKTLLITIIILVLIIVIILSGVYLTVRPAEIVLLEDEMQIRGAYGQNIDYSQIEDMFFRDYLEDVKSKVQGISFIIFSKGTYELKDSLVASLYVKKGNSAYVYIKLPEKYVIINRNTKEQTKELFEQIFTKWREQR